MKKFTFIPLILILLCIALFTGCGYPKTSSMIVSSGSMEPTIETNQRVLIHRYTIFKNITRGDIIVFQYPDGESIWDIKRVIGLPNETVEIIQGITYINGEKLDEPYLKEEPKERDFGPYQIPPDSYFVLGDNRNNSNDARYWKNTYVSKQKIKGFVCFIYN